jgi:hypothetical protein
MFIRRLGIQMKLFRCRIYAFAACFAITFQAGAVLAQNNATDQVDPYTAVENQRKRAKFFDDCAERRMHKDRMHFGMTNGLLAQELQMRLGGDLTDNRTDRLISVVTEWLEVFPKIPCASQNYLAGQALHFAKELHNDKVEAQSRYGLVEARPHPSWTNEYSYLGAKMEACLAAAATKAALTMVPEENAFQARTLTHDLEAKLTQCFPSKQTTMQQVYPIRTTTKPSKKNLKGAGKDRSSELSPSEGKVEEGANLPSQMEISIFSDADSKKILDMVKSLTKLYPTLGDNTKHENTAKLMNLTAILLRSNLHDAGETLFWELYNSIDLAWIDLGSIAGGLGANSAYFWQSNHLESAEKVMLKELEVVDFNDQNMATQVNLRIVLAQLYDQMGRKKAAKKQYLAAKKYNDILLNSDAFAGLSSDGAINDRVSIEQGLAKN